jgi:cyclopropane-fatty-acyl-phospholipid synthase
MALASLLAGFVKGDLPIAIEAYDGSRAGPRDAEATMVIRSRDAINRVVTRPGELGIARAYVAGDLDIEGDVFAFLKFAADAPELRLDPKLLTSLVKTTGLLSLRPLPPPPEEARLRGGLHSRSRDRDAISHHYDVSNEFYGMVLGESMTYSCAVFTDPSEPLARAQEHKYELIARKLGLGPDTRLLDVGCGWGGMVLHAAHRHHARAVGVTISRQQQDLAARRVADAGLTDRIEVRLEDYRDIVDGPFDAISSIGMFEHVGRARMQEYFTRLYDLLSPGGRLLNHAISRPGYPQPDTPIGRTAAITRRIATAAGSRTASKISSDFMDRYVFPDGELHEVGVVTSMLQDVGFEVRHVETLREHYALTLRRWVANLETNWDAAVAEVGGGRARVWRLYMAASALAFERNDLQVHQVQAVRTEDGRSGVPLRPAFN